MNRYSQKYNIFRKNFANLTTNHRMSCKYFVNNYKK